MNPLVVSTNRRQFITRSLTILGVAATGEAVRRAARGSSTQERAAGAAIKTERRKRKF